MPTPAVACEVYEQRRIQGDASKLHVSLIVRSATDHLSHRSNRDEPNRKTHKIAAPCASDLITDLPEVQFNTEQKLMAKHAADVGVHTKNGE